MNDEPIRVDVRVTRGRPVTFLTDDIDGGRFEPPPSPYLLEGIHVTDVDFSGLVLDSVMARGCLFERCDFTKARFHRCGLSLGSQSIYRDCRFDRTDLHGASPGPSRFEHCTFDHAKLDGWRMSATEFIGCRFVGPLRKMEFGARPIVNAVQRRERNEIRDNDFREADLQDVEFRGGVDLDAQRWPDDPSYVRLDTRPATLDRLAPFVDRLPLEDRPPVANLAWVRGRFAGQDEILVREGTWRWYRRLLRLAAVN